MRHEVLLGIRPCLRLLVTGGASAGGGVGCVRWPSACSGLKASCACGLANVFFFHLQGHATILHQAAGFLFGRVHEGVRQSFRTGVNCRRKLLASTVASAGIIISDVISKLVARDLGGRACLLRVWLVKKEQCPRVDWPAVRHVHPLVIACKKYLSAHSLRLGRSMMQPSGSRPDGPTKCTLANMREARICCGHSISLTHRRPHRMNMSWRHSRHSSVLCSCSSRHFGLWNLTGRDLFSRSITYRKVCISRESATPSIKMLGCLSLVGRGVPRIATMPFQKNMGSSIHAFHVACTPCQPVKGLGMAYHSIRHSVGTIL